MTSVHGWVIISHCHIYKHSFIHTLNSNLVYLIYMKHLSFPATNVCTLMVNLLRTIRNINWHVIRPCLKLFIITCFRYLHARLRPIISILLSTFSKTNLYAMLVNGTFTLFDTCQTVCITSTKIGQFPRRWIQRYIRYICDVKQRGLNRHGIDCICMKCSISRIMLASACMY